MRNTGLVLMLLGAHLGATLACAEEAHGSRVFKAALGRGRSLYSIATQKFATTEAGDFFQLVVVNADGGTVWTGPRKADDTDPLVFGAWHFGVSLPECVGDIDGDGRIELVAPAPRSDVSPAGFRVLRWTGSAFVPVRSEILLEQPGGSGRYPWARTDETAGRWVDHFIEVSKGSVTAGIVEYRGGDSYRCGTALLSPNAGGYKVTRWIHPMVAPKGYMPLIKSVPRPSPRASSAPSTLPTTR